MAHTGGDKITFMGSKGFSLLADKHLDLSGDDQTTLVKGMFMAGIFLAGCYIHAYHYQTVAYFRLAHNARSKRLQLQGVYIPKSHAFLLAVE